MMRDRNNTIDVLRHGDSAEVILSTGVFYTPARLFDMGMIACNLCGTILSIDKKYCPQCQEWIICIHEDYVNDKKHAKKTKIKNPITPYPRIGEGWDHYVARFIRDMDMQERYPKALKCYQRAEYLYTNRTNKSRKK